MERKEAIEILKELWRYEKSDKYTDEEIREAISAAISSLETDEAYQLEYERTTKNDLGVDCVARQDVERFIEGFINEYTPEEELEFINLELDGLKHLPPVTPQEPKTGHWIGDSYGYTCSNCEHNLNDLAQSMDYISFSKPKYCPNCGCRMD